MLNFLKYLEERQRLDPETQAFRRTKAPRWDVVLNSRYVLPVYLQNRLSKHLHDVPSVYALHITGANSRRLRQIIGTSNSQKGISTSTTILNSNAIKSGVGSEGGAIYILKGYPTIAAPVDIYSAVDQAGEKFFDLEKIWKYMKLDMSTFNAMSKDFQKRFSLAIEKELGNLIDLVPEYRQSRERRHLRQALLDKPRTKESQKIKQSVVTAYYKMMPDFLSKWKATIENVISTKAVIRDNIFTPDYTTYEAPNEIVMTNYKIIHALLWQRMHENSIDYPEFDDLLLEVESQGIKTDVYQRDEIEDMVSDANEWVQRENKKILR